MAKLVLFGPDTRHGATARKGFKRYVWYIRWPGGQRSTGFGHDQKVDAEQALARFIIDHGRREVVGPRRPDEIGIADVLRIYLDEHAWRVVDPARIAYAAKALLPYWGDRLCSDIGGNACRAYVKWRADRGCGAGTSRRELGTLRAALCHAEREGYLTVAPPVVLPDQPPPRDRWLTRSEVAKLIRAARRTRARRYLPLFIAIAFYTGARKEAVLSLQWQPNTTGGWVDLGRKVIVWKTSTTKKRRPRETPLPRPLASLLTARYGTGRTGFVLYGSSSGQTVGSIKTAWRSIVKATGIEATPHTLRHTRATHLVQAGVPLWEVAGYLEMTIRTLERVYGHHHKDYLKSAVNAINRRCK